MLVKEDRLKSVSTTLFYFYDVLENYLEKTKNNRSVVIRGQGERKGLTVEGTGKLLGMTDLFYILTTVVVT